MKPSGLTAALVVLSAVGGCVSGTAPRAGFWFEDASFSLPADAATTLGGPLQPRERELIERVSRAELERAFAGLRIAIVPNRDAFWRVEVLRSLPRRGPLPRAGESLALGSLGGAGGVDFTFVAVLAVRYAPPGASRRPSSKVSGEASAESRFTSSRAESSVRRRRADRDDGDSSNIAGPIGRRGPMAHCAGPSPGRSCERGSGPAIEVEGVPRGLQGSSERSVKPSRLCDGAPTTFTKSVHGIGLPWIGTICETSSFSFRTAL